MLYNAKNRTLSIENRTVDYISFGSSEQTLIMLPGLSDGLRTVKGSALPFAVMYRSFAKKYKVYVFSRANQLKSDFTTRDMACDVKLSMDALGISTASVLGVSQGGMIAQYLALDYPETVEKLVLAVTLTRQNDTVNKVLRGWIDMARRGDYRGLMLDTAEKSYGEAYLRTHRWLFPLLALSGKPKGFTRFIIQAESCLGHDTYDRLPEIKRPTLILGGKRDQIVGATASKEIAKQIKGSELYMYDRFGHAAYEETPDFNERVLNFHQR